ncbi:permease-like cell division protein FtsX [Myxococcota bacterium]|nr:permease-like cell division protein FtsX [Myxococcota bacterium]MBU1533796.1 permease-like cell division protein FtsX [Myxococcota bacterium]
MRNLFYHCKKALVEFKNKPGSHFFAVGTVALALVLAGSVFLVSQVLRYASDTWGNGAMVAIYLDQGTTPDRVDAIKSRISELEGIYAIKTITPDVARKRLVANLQRDASLISNVEPTFFPHSLEVVIRGDRNTVERTRRTLGKLKGIVAGISDIRGVHTWNRKIGYIIDIMLLIGLILLTLVLFASGYVIMSTTRLSIESRLDELKVIKFLGASPAFIQTPLLLTGMLQGLLGALVAFGVLFGLAHFTFPLITALVGNALVGTNTLVFFTPVQLLSGLGIATATGLIAGKLALSTIRV